jgi:putative acetyltransferase
VTFPIARAEDFAALKLETGIYQPAALALYRSAGFAEVPPFGEYEADPVSVFMAKTIA